MLLGGGFRECLDINPFQNLPSILTFSVPMLLVLERQYPSLE